MVTLNIELNNPNRQDQDERGSDFNIDFSQKIYFNPRSSQEIGYVFNTEPARMSLITHISKNLPNNLIIDFPGFTEIRNATAIDGITKIPFRDSLALGNEVITDNEDRGFSVHQETDQAFLKSLVKKGKSQHYKYARIQTWEPPRQWNTILRSEFYGRYIHSASYTRAGTGERGATWKAHLTGKASYEVFFFLDKLNGMWRRGNKLPVYSFRIYHDQGNEKVILNSADAEDGWNYLGTYSFTKDSARVELTNQTPGDFIVADAVKWVGKE